MSIEGQFGTENTEPQKNEGRKYIEAAVVIQRALMVKQGITGRTEQAKWVEKYATRFRNIFDRSPAEWVSGWEHDPEGTVVKLQAKLSLKTIH